MKESQPNGEAVHSENSYIFGCFSPSTGEVNLEIFTSDFTEIEGVHRTQVNNYVFSAHSRITFRKPTSVVQFGYGMLRAKIKSYLST